MNDIVEMERVQKKSCRSSVMRRVQPKWLYCPQWKARYDWSPYRNTEMAHLVNVVQFFTVRTLHAARRCSLGLGAHMERLLYGNSCEHVVWNIDFLWRLFGLWCGLVVGQCHWYHPVYPICWYYDCDIVVIIYYNPETLNVHRLSSVRCYRFLPGPEQPADQPESDGERRDRKPPITQVWCPRVCVPRLTTMSVLSLQRALSSHSVITGLYTKCAFDTEQQGGARLTSGAWKAQRSMEGVVCIIHWRI